MDAERPILVEMTEREAELCLDALDKYALTTVTRRVSKTIELAERVERAIAVERKPGGVLWPK